MSLFNLIYGRSSIIKPESAIKVAWSITSSLDFEDELLMHQPSTSRVEMFIPAIKDEHFINGKNNFKTDKH